VECWVLFFSVYTSTDCWWHFQGLVLGVSRAVISLDYADDIVLLAPSASALRMMFVICENYTKDYSISFNASKSKRLVIMPANRWCLNDYVRKCTFYVGDNPIEYIDYFVHHGHFTTNHLADNDNILRRRNEFIGQVNNVLCFFSKLKSCTEIHKHLFQSYCMSLYDCELWLFSNIYIEELCVSWRKYLQEFGDCRTKLTATYCCCWVLKTRSVGGHYILYVNARVTAHS